MAPGKHCTLSVVMHAHHSGQTFGEEGGCVALALKNGTPVDFSTGDLEVLALALGAKLVQNVQESTPKDSKPEPKQP